MTALALLGPIGIAVVSNKLLERPFWIALVTCSLLHGLLVWRFLPSLPFSTLGVAILFGALECFGLGIVSAKIVQLSG